MIVALDRELKLYFLHALRNGFVDTDDKELGRFTNLLQIEVVYAKDEIERLEQLRKELGLPNDYV